jgi:hypothetical protein
MFNRSSLGYSIGLGGIVGALALLITALIGGPFVFLLAYASVIALSAMSVGNIPAFKARFRLAFASTATMSLIHAIALVFMRPMWGAPAWHFAWHFAAFTIQAVLLALVIAALSHSSQRPVTA